MKECVRVLTILLVLVFPAAGEPSRTAVVDVQELFRQFHKSVQAQEEINLERARIQKENNDARQRIRVMDEALKELQRRLGDPALRRAASEDERKKLQRELLLRSQERDNFERDRKRRAKSRHQELNQKMVARMQGILQEIRHHVEVTGEKAGFDYVFDVAGLNTSQVPFVLYAKDATDITPIILKELNKEGPRGDGR